MQTCQLSFLLVGVVRSYSTAFKAILIGKKDAEVPCRSSWTSSRTAGKIDWIIGKFGTVEMCEYLQRRTICCVDADSDAGEYFWKALDKTYNKCLGIPSAAFTLVYPWGVDVCEFKSQKISDKMVAVFCCFRMFPSLTVLVKIVFRRLSS